MATAADQVPRVRQALLEVGAQQLAQEMTKEHKQRCLERTDSAIGDYGAVSYRARFFLGQRPASLQSD
jgi:hypothetical protein